MVVEDQHQMGVHPCCRATASLGREPESLQVAASISKVRPSYVVRLLCFFKLYLDLSALTAGVPKYSTIVYCASVVSCVPALAVCVFCT